MKTTILTLLSCVFLLSAAMAQTPQSINYQTVVRNSDGAILAGQSLDMRMTVSINSSDVYEEEHSVTTNDHGLVSLAIGTGSSSDNFDNINWAAGDAELTVEVDDGSGYETLGTSELRSVPFALHAQTVENADDADADPNNEIQTLTLDGNSLSISGGNEVTLPSGGSEVDEDALTKAFAHVSIFGDVNTTFDSYNVTGATKSTTGVYIVSLEPGLFATPANNPTVIASVNNDLSPGVAIATFGTSPSQITVRTYDMSGSLSDREFSVAIHGK